jgi:hypothetical protein
MCSKEPIVGSKAVYERTRLYPPSVMFSNWDELRVLWSWESEVGRHTVTKIPLDLVRMWRTPVRMYIGD